MKNKRHHKLENMLEQVFYSLFRQWIAVSCIYYYYLDITNLLLCMVGDFDYNQGIIYSNENNFYIKFLIHWQGEETTNHQGQQGLPNHPVLFNNLVYV